MSWSIDRNNLDLNTARKASKIWLVKDSKIQERLVAYKEKSSKDGGWRGFEDLETGQYSRDIKNHIEYEDQAFGFTKHELVNKLIQLHMKKVEEAKKSIEDHQKSVELYQSIEREILAGE